MRLRLRFRRKERKGVEVEEKKREAILRLMKKIQKVLQAFLNLNLNLAILKMRIAKLSIDK